MSQFRILLRFGLPEIRAHPKRHCAASSNSSHAFRSAGHMETCTWSRFVGIGSIPPGLCIDAGPPVYRHSQDMSMKLREVAGRSSGRRGLLSIQHRCGAGTNQRCRYSIVAAPLRSCRYGVVAAPLRSCRYSVVAAPLRSCRYSVVAAPLRSCRYGVVAAPLWGSMRRSLSRVRQSGRQPTFCG